MDDDVSVTRLPDDTWGNRVPPTPGSRLRVLAVMGAVVVGCLVAAVVVGVAGDDGLPSGPDGDPVVALPDRSTSGVAGPDVTGTRQAGYSTGVTTPESTRTTTTTTSTTTTTAPPTTTSETAGNEVTTTTPPPPPSRPDPSSPSPSAPPPSPPATTVTTTTEPEDDCPWWYIFC